MPLQYALDTPFQLDGISVHVMNIKFARHTAPIPSHSHGSGCWEIHYISTGRGTLVTGGRQYSISPGALFVTGPYVEHAQAPNESDPMQEYCIYLRLRSKRGSSVLSAFCSTPFWFQQDDGRVHGLMRQLLNELEQQLPGYLTAAQLLVAQLLIELSRRCSAAAVCTAARPVLPAGDPNTLLIEECFLYEYANITLPQLAKRLGLSTRQTQRLLLQTYASTFRQMKADAQMSAAKSLLQTSSHSITAIAERLGFSSSEHFSSAFRRHFGISPNAYRKKLHDTTASSV